MDIEVALRTSLITLGAFIALLALAAMQARAVVRALAVLSALATAAYAVCTGADEIGPAMPGPVMWAVFFLCAALPAIFWAFASTWFDDEYEPGGWSIVAIGVLGALGLLSLGYQSGGLGILRRVLGAGLLMHLFWRLWRGAAVDLVSERLRARQLIIGVAGAYILGVIAVELWLAGNEPPAGLQAFNLAAICVVTALMGIALCRWDLRDPPEPAPAQEPSAAVPRAGAPHPLPRADAVLVAALERAMRDEHLYRREGLSVTELAAHLGTQEHRLRRAIHQGLGLRNFNELMHRYRLDEVERRLREDADVHLPILTLALEAGYSSIGPFNRAFKARYGITPSAYRER